MEQKHAKNNFSPNDSVLKVFVTKNTYDYENPWAAPTQHESSGSGFIIEGKRIVTNAHVVSNSSFIQVRKAGSSKKYKAVFRRVSHSIDLAILESKLGDFFDNTTPLILGQTPRVGDKVRAYGFPWGGDEMSLTEGVVSRIEMDHVYHSNGTVLACDMDTAITNGNSGGPVMSTPGVDDNNVFNEPAVVGVVFQGRGSKEGGYMIAAQVLRKFISLDDLGEELRIPELGIYTQILENWSFRKSLGLGTCEGISDRPIVLSENNPRSEENDEKSNSLCDTIFPDIQPEIKEGEIDGGIMVYKIADFSPVKYLLQKGDVLLQIDDFEIGENGTVEFRKGERTNWTYCIGQKCIGESVKLRFFRDGVYYTKTIKLDKTRKDIKHIGEKLYDVKPNYIIKAGFVFQPLTYNLYLAISISTAVHAKTLGDRTIKNPGYVLMTKTLQCDSTTGFDMTNEIVERVNGKNVHSLEDLLDAFKEGIEFRGCMIKNSKEIQSSETLVSLQANKIAIQEKQHFVELYGGTVIRIISSNLEEDTRKITREYDIKETEFMGK